MMVAGPDVRVLAAKDRRLQSSSDARHALAFAERTAAVCTRVLGERLASIILHGSLVLDDYTPPSSDIDLLGVVERPLHDSEIESLIRALVAVEREAAARVDLRLATRAAAAAPPPAPPTELYIRFGGDKPAIVEPRIAGEPDLAVELSICREHGRSLRGATPDALIAEVPERFVVAAGDRQLARWQSLTADTAYAALMVLTACRIWRFGLEGTHSSKRAAESWALARDPSLAVARDALRQRAGCRVRIEPREIGRLLRIVRAQIAGRAGEPRSSDGA